MQIIYKDIAIDVKNGTTVNQLLHEEIQKAKCKIIACKFNNEIKLLMNKNSYLLNTFSNTNKQVE